MNIFYLNSDPERAAQLQYNKHVVKMILESAQLLCSAHIMLGSEIDVPYKLTHKNHPSNVWVRQSSAHYGWLVELFVALSFEYERRYNKQHKTFTKLFKTLTSPPTRIAHDPFVPPPQAMPDDYKDDDAITAYRRFYVLDKHDRRGIVNYKHACANYIEEWREC